MVIRLAGFFLESPVINDAGIKLTKEFEDFREYAYPDPASELYRETVGMKLGWGKRPAREILAALPAEFQSYKATPWTVGFGFTRGVDIDSRMSRYQASTRLIDELEECASSVAGLCQVVPNENQLAAMSDLAFNIGISRFKGSTVLRAHNSGDFAAAARAFSLWNKAGGRVLVGLERRRKAEAVLYLTPVKVEAPVNPVGVVDHPEPEMPQTVDEERPMTASRINQAGTVAGGTAALATVAETAHTLTDIRSSALGLGDWLLPILLLLIAGLCGYIVWQRVLQRRGGWA